MGTDMRKFVVWMIVLAMGLMACSSDDVDEEGSFNVDEEPWVSATLDVSPEVVEFSPDVDGESEQSREVVIENEGPGPVTIIATSTTVDSSPSFTQVEGAVKDPVILEEGETHEVRVLYDPDEVGRDEGRLRVMSNSHSMREVEVDLVSEALHRTLFVQPSVVHFPQTVVGGQLERSVQLRNLGRHDLTVESATITSGDAYFHGGDERWDSPVTIEAGAREELSLIFEPEHEGPETGELVLESDDPDAAQVEVELLGNGLEPCLEVLSGDLEFGGSTVGQESREIVSVRNCSPEAQLEVESIETGELSSAGSFEAVDEAFEVDEESLNSETPIMALGPGEMDYFWVHYEPQTEGEDKGILEIVSNDRGAPHYLDMNGEGIADPCPEAVITASMDGEEVALEEPTIVRPLDIIDFSAGESVEPDGGELTYHWELVERPMTSMVEFDDSSAEEPWLMFSTTGQYRVELQVETASGVEACSPETVQFMAVPEGDIHVELSWQMPLAEDGVGGDLDLHYLRSDGQWGQAPYSVYWSNAAPDWGDGSEVGLDIDDLTGELPETVVHSNASSEYDYQVGVHFLSANPSASPAQAVVEVYVQGQLLYSAQEVFYQSASGATSGDSGDFWHVAEITVDDDGFVEVEPLDQFYEDEGFPE